VRNRLAEADREVCDAYKKISAARSKKKSPSKREKEVSLDSGLVLGLYA
jgi:hypothetical protein